MTLAEYIVITGHLRAALLLLREAQELADRYAVAVGSVERMTLAIANAEEAILVLRENCGIEK